MAGPAIGLWLQPVAEVPPGTRKEETLSDGATLFSQEICRKEDLACLCPCAAPSQDGQRLPKSPAWQGGYPCERSEDHMQGRKLLKSRERLLSSTRSLPITSPGDLFFSCGLLLCTVGVWLEWERACLACMRPWVPDLFM